MRSLKTQVLPIILTVITFLLLATEVYFFIHLLNIISGKEDIRLQLRVSDIFVGVIIYIKTSFDFAIFIGNLMRSNPGWKNRVAIELGTAIGNATGTLSILGVWSFFREVPLLMAIMITLASLILLQMAQESTEELLKKQFARPLKPLMKELNAVLLSVNTVTAPILKYILPQKLLTKTPRLSFFRLMVFSISVPFILGLDDFAGYIPLFSIVNVLGFSVGVLLGHMTLNIFLFLSPQRTEKAVAHPIILLFGSIAFAAVALWGFFEVYRLFFS